MESIDEPRKMNQPCTGESPCPPRSPARFHMCVQWDLTGQEPRSEKHPFMGRAARNPYRGPPPAIEVSIQVAPEATA